VSQIPSNRALAAEWRCDNYSAAWTVSYRPMDNQPEKPDLSQQTFGTFRIPSSWAWRVPSAVQALPGLIQMVFVFLGPESPRWLISRGRDAQALQMLAYYHAQGDE
jgi:Sugar (and other) transporter